MSTTEPRLCSKYLNAMVPITVATIVMLSGCSRSVEPPPAISLVQEFSAAEVSESPIRLLDFPDLEWRFDGESPLAPKENAGATVGWSAFNDITDLGVNDGRLEGRAGDMPILMVDVPEDAFPKDRLWAVELKLRISAGSKLGIDTFRDDEVDKDDFLKDLEETGQSAYMIDLRPGDDVATYTLTESNATFSKMEAIGGLKHIALRFVDADGADFALESFRIIPRTEHLAGVPAGVSWQGLAGVFRETLVARAPEKLTWQQDLGERPWLDLAIGTPDNHPIVFRAEVASPGRETIIRERTITAGDRWEPFAVDLEELAGRQVTLTLSLASDEDGHIGFWGAPAIRHRGARPAVIRAVHRPLSARPGRPTARRHRHRRRHPAFRSPRGLGLRTAYCADSRRPRD